MLGVYADSLHGGPWAVASSMGAAWGGSLQWSSILVSRLQVGWAGGVTGVQCLVKVVVRK